MSETVAAKLATPAPREQSYFEQQIFARSPFGILPTALVLFLVLLGSYLVIASLERIPAIVWKVRGVSLTPGMWPALVTSLLICTILAMQRYARLRETKEFSAYTGIFKSGAAAAAEATAFMPRGVRLVPATLVGLIGGFAASALIFVHQGAGMFSRAPGIFIWFVVANTMLIVLFARGTELSRKADASLRALVDGELRIDLLRIDALDVLGRSAARGALVWFAISAVICLFFVGGQSSWFVIGLLIACAAIGLWIFVRVIERVHRRIRAAKNEELERLRRQIDRARGQMHEQAEAATRVQGLLAYEARIAAAPEWPFDQTTLVRLGASALILSLPWFGQALAASLVEHIGGAVH